MSNPRPLFQKAVAMPDSQRIIELKLNEAPPYHPEYHKLCAEWSFYEASYVGGRRYVNANDAEGEPVFIKHEHESDAGQKRRKKFSVYHNYPKAIVDKFVSYVHEYPITRADDEQFSDWSKYVKLPELMREASRKAAIYGRFHYLLDTNKDATVETMAQAEAQGVTIAIRSLNPRRIIDWDNDYDKLLVVHDDPEYPDGVICLWDDINYQKAYLDKRGKVMKIDAPIAHGWKKIPIVTIIGLNNDSGSPIADICEISRIIYNEDSLLREELQRQTFSQWWITGVDPEAISAGSKEIGSRRIIAINTPAQNVSFTRMSSDPSQAESIRTSMEADVKEIYRMCGLRLPEVTSTGPESGKALKVRFVETALMAAALASNAEKMENQIINLYNGATGSGIENPEYPDVQDFDEAQISEELQNTLNTITAELPIELKEATVKQYAEKAFVNLPNSEKDDIMKAIEEFYEKKEVEGEVVPELPSVMDGIKAEDMKKDEDGQQQEK